MNFFYLSALFFLMNPLVGQDHFSYDKKLAKQSRKNELIGLEHLPLENKLAKQSGKNRFEDVLNTIIKIQHKHGDSPYTYFRKGTYRTHPALYYYKFRAEFEIALRDSSDKQLNEAMKDYTYLHRIAGNYLLTKDTILYKRFHDYISMGAERALLLHKYLIAEQYSHYLAEVFHDTIPAYRKIYIPLYNNHRMFSKAQLDSFARIEPSFKIHSTKELSEYLTTGLQTYEQKVWAIYMWVCTHIEYDYEGYKHRNFWRESPMDAIYLRKVVCEGYANLFLELCELSGVKAVKIVGRAKSSDDVMPGPHAYNAIWFNNEWKLIDCTWAAGSGQYNYFYFADPQKMILTHFPDNPDFQLLEKKVTWEEFVRRNR